MFRNFLLITKKVPFIYLFCIAFPAWTYFFLKKSKQKNIHKTMILSKNLIFKFL
jgi:hypothetical protein